VEVLEVSVLIVNGPFKLGLWAYRG
jgi:hypothetical protein